MANEKLTFSVKAVSAEVLKSAILLRVDTVNCGAAKIRRVG